VEKQRDEITLNYPVSFATFTQFLLHFHANPFISRCRSYTKNSGGSNIFVKGCGPFSSPSPSLPFLLSFTSPSRAFFPLPSLPFPFPSPFPLTVVSNSVLIKVTLSRQRHCKGTKTGSGSGSGSRLSKIFSAYCNLSPLPFSSAPNIFLFQPPIQLENALMHFTVKSELLGAHLCHYNYYRCY